MHSTIQLRPKKLIEPVEPLPKKLLEQVRDVLRIKHYSYRTEESYLAWMRRYVLFHNKRQPKDMGSIEIEAFLSHLAVTETVAASTQSQALCALHYGLHFGQALI
jgi:Phage integrase, N-terminal SAM-like domain